MKTTMEFTEELKRIINEQRYYSSALDVLYCDYWHALPKDGIAYMEQVSGFLLKQKQAHLIHTETKNILSYAQGVSEEVLDVYTKGMIHYLQHAYDEATKLPIELTIELNALCNEAQSVWQTANKTSDFSLFRPYLEKQFTLQKKIAKALDPNRPVYEVLMNRFDEGYTLKELDDIFMKVKKGVLAILKEVKKKEGNKIVYGIQPSLEVKKELAQKAIEIINFDKDKATFYEMHHPVCVCTGPRDSRPSSNYTNVWKGIFALLHECGHGIYNYSSNDTVISYGLWGGVDGSFHESQSRFYEIIIGRNKAFWKYYYPVVQDRIPQLKDVNLDDFYASIMQVKPSPIRLQADELTCVLHIIIRYEMEKEYFEGSLSLDDFPAMWNKKYKEYLGVTIQNDQEGILQDVHWASGYIGYFQSYALGDMYATMFYDVMKKQGIDVEQNLAQGNLNEINAWLYEHIHQYGQTFTTKELLNRVCGSGVEVDVYLSYLRDKFL